MKIYKEEIQESITIDEAVQLVRFFSKNHIEKQYIKEYLEKIREQKTLE